MSFIITPKEEGQRLDVCLHQHFPDLSRSRIQSLIKSGHIYSPARKISAHCPAVAGMEIVVEIPAPVPAVPQPENISLDILYEDSDILVLNKAAGRVVHPAAGHPAGTLVNALLHHCKDLAGIGGELRPGIVHRLDKDTSGVMVVAKNDKAMAGLVDQFKNRRLTKEYVAIVQGLPSPVEGRIETLIGRNPNDRKKMSARPVHGREARTSYRVLETFAGYSLVRVLIQTGRTHQIRVHMAHMGHPVMGDRQYGRCRGAPRQMLHAERLVLRHPVTGAPLEFKAPLPADMQATLETLRRAVK